MRACVATLNQHLFNTGLGEAVAPFANIMITSCTLSVSAPLSSTLSLRLYSAVPPSLCTSRKVVGRARPSGRSRVLCRANPLVYIATLPLVGWESLEVMLRDKYPDELALHSMVLLKTEDSVTMFDFLPELPKSPVVAAALLCGRQVKGVTRERSLSQLPVRRCWLVGPCTQQQVQLVVLSSMCVLASRVHGHIPTLRDSAGKLSIAGST